MSNDMAINGYYDPYFLQAYQYYNPYLQNAATVQASQNTTLTVPVGQTAKPEEKKKSKAGWILGTVALVGAAMLFRKGYKAGSGEGFAKVWDGIKKISTNSYNGVKNKVSEYIHPEKFTIVEKGGKKVCTIPGELNVLKGADLAKNAEKLGISTEAPAIFKTLEGGTQVLAEGVNIKELTINHKTYGKIKVVDGKIAEWTSKNGNPTSWSSNDKAVGVVETLIKNIREGKGLDNQVENIVFTHKGSDAVRTFTKANKDAEAKLVEISTKYHLLDSDIVNARRLRDSGLDKALTDLNSGKNDGLKALKMEFNDAEAGKFIKENGKIVEVITKDGTILKPGTTAYDSYQYKFQEAFKNALDAKEENCNVISWILG